MKTIKKFRRNEVALTITLSIIFMIAGFIAELALCVATFQFWASGTFMAGLYWLRKIIYAFLLGAHVWTIKEFFYGPYKRLTKLF